ncbi:hypothetical protein LSM04_003898 [Trypanosoma melophagium]|uniref:uncharacterized protein n=1 Tax=Trypanosoma melophagium TaxID=715481 RepID=UPI00351A9764|nr:hypothetical protein LSM04_003898 [Trypanosoma melophagium]
MREHEVISSDVAFSACSAFEFGGDVHNEEKGDGSSGIGSINTSSSIVALKYPLKDLHKYTARPFEYAIVRLTRDSLSVYRPTDRIFFCKLNWCDVREIRRHMSKKENQILYEFGFFTYAAGILVLETHDAMIVDGIIASLQLLNVECILQTSNSQTTTTPTVALTGATGTGSIRARSVSTTPRAVSSPLNSVSLSREPAARATSLTQVAPRDNDMDQTLRRIRQREEEMREAIFYGPPTRSPATNSYRHLNSYSPPRPEFYPREDVRPPRREVELTAAGMHNLMMLLEEEEKKATRSLRTQEERIRTLCSHKETNFRERPWQHRGSSTNTANSDFMHHVRPAIVESESRDVHEKTDMLRRTWSERDNSKTQLMIPSDIGSPKTSQLHDGPQELEQKMGHEPIPRNMVPGDVTTKKYEKSESITEGNHVASAPVILSTTKEHQEPKTGGVLYGNWKELRHKDSGKVYYRHMVTEEALWKLPLEVLEMKKRKKKQYQRSRVQQKRRKDLFGFWVFSKEYKDPKSGRLYYVNGEIKHRTWKAEETPFGDE